MNSRGQLFTKGELPNRSQTLRAYQNLTTGHLSDFKSLSDQQLDWLMRIHDQHLDFYREERRMHFGAFALVGLAFIILFPALLSAQDHFLPLLGVEILLFILLLPYTFVYRRYEEGVRRMMREAVLLSDEQYLRLESNGR